MTRLNYSEVSDIEYNDAEGSVILTPEQQSLAVQAVSIFRELYNWQDGSTEADDIDALVADTIAALTFITIPPKEDMNNRINLFPYMGVVAAGNGIIFTTAGAWQQSPATNGSMYQINGVKLAPGYWGIYAYCYKQSSAGKLKIEVKEVSTGTVINSRTTDLYSATTTLSTVLISDFTLTEIKDTYLQISADGKHASSSSYVLPVVSYGLEIL